MISVKTKIKVLIVDDSAIVRKILTQQLNKCEDIDVIATAPDPFIARDKIIALEPDVMTLDVEMPKMDGITFLKKIMQHHPMPVIILSSLTPQGSKTAMEALASGAVDVISKPGSSYTVGQACDNLIEKIRVASKAHISKTERSDTCESGRLHMAETTNKILAIGASTGGVQALISIIQRLPSNAPGTVIVQHMPAQFTTSFAQRLDGLSAVSVKEAKNGDSVIPGQVLIAPGGFHMLLQRSGASYYVVVKDGPPVCHQKPSVEVLFNSVAKYAGANAVGAILTGMGNDGAKGLLNMRQNGAHTIAQDEASCIVFGMPKEAIKENAAEKILPLDSIPQALLNFAVN